MPPSTGTTRRWLRRPSSQVSQWRRRRSSYARAEDGFPASPSVFALQAVVGAAVREDLGDWTSRRFASTHSKASTPVASEVSLRGSPPARSSAHTCEEPSRAERNAIRAPSGLHRGRESDAGVGRDPSRLAARHRHEPQVRVALAPGEVDLGEGEGHPRPVGRDLRVGQAPELHHLGGGERGRRGARGRREAGEAQGECGGETRAHGQPPGCRAGPSSRRSQATVRFMKAAVEGQPVRNSHDSRMAAGASSRGQSAKACRAK